MASYLNFPGMNVTKRALILIPILIVLAAVVVAALFATRPPRYTVIHVFPAVGRQGKTPMGLTMDDSGNLYGTTWPGGSGAWGTIFELARPALFRSTWEMDELSDMGCKAAGGSPFWSMLNKNGELYGATANCGTRGAGILFKLQPTEHGWSEPTPLLAFPPRSSGDMMSGLIADASGSLYGTTKGHSGPDAGTVFKLGATQNGWEMTVLHRFKNGDDGAYPTGGLVMDHSGILYGTTSGGGKDRLGTVFRLTPTDRGWDEAVIHTFRTSDGSNGDGGLLPMAGLTLDVDGTLYGTTGGGGKFDRGVVFSLTRQRNSDWTKQILYSFRRGDGDGSAPNSPLVIGKSGELYGTTKFGGAEPGLGTVFRLVRTATGWDEEVLHRFAGGPDGGTPDGPLVRSAYGTLFGATIGGSIHNGVYTDGTVYEIAP